VSVEVQFPAVSSPSDFMLKRLWFEYTQLWTRKYSQTSEERRDGTGRSLWQLMEELQPAALYSEEDTMVFKLRGSYSRLN